jgi:hypothetical protein
MHFPESLELGEVLVDCTCNVLEFVILRDVHHEFARSSFSNIRELRVVVVLCSVQVLSSLIVIFTVLGRTSLLHSQLQVFVPKHMDSDRGYKDSWTTSIGFVRVVLCVLP